MKWQQVLSTFNLFFQSSQKYSSLVTAVPHRMKTLTIPFKPVEVNTMSNVWRSLCVTLMVEKTISYFELYKYLYQ